MRLKDKVAIVTGAGSGIGKAIALAFVKEGARVTIADVNLEGAEKTAGEVEKLKGESLTIKADVSQGEEVDQIITKTEEKFGKLDILVNNAGIEILGTVEGISEQDWDRLISIHLKGGHNCTKRAIPDIEKQGKGKIINIASVAAFVAAPFLSLYSTSKGGIVAYTRSCAVELAPRKINVNAICPGFIQTAMTADYLESEGMRNMVLERIPLGVIGQPDRDVAPLAVFLASEDSDYITGQAIIVDGGYSCM